MIKIFNIKLFIFIYFLLNPFELLANIWEGTIDNKKVIIVYNGVKIDGKLKKTFRMRLSDLCIYGNVNFPKSPPDYRFEKEQSAKNPNGVIVSWNYHWAMAFRNLNGSNGYKIKRCKSNWENFVDKKNIISASGYQDNKFESLSDDIICKYAVYKNVRRSSPSAAPYVKEAKRRMLSCFLEAKLKKENKDRFTKVEIPKIDELKFRWLQDQTICKYAVYQNAFRNSLSASPYVKEAKRRGLTCGIKSAKAEKIKIAEKKAMQEKQRQAELEREQRLKAEQERIKKKAAEAERKKKKLEKERKRKISIYKNKATNLYKDINKFVKLDNEIDLIKLSELYSKRPKITQKWDNDEIKNFENLLVFLEKNNEFITFQKSQNKKRTEDFILSKQKNLSQLKLNLEQLKKLLKENFGNDEKMKEINSIYLLISEFLKNAYESKKAKLLVNKSSKFLNKYKQDKIKIVEIRRDLIEKKVTLLDIVKNDFGSNKAISATKLLKMINKENTLVEMEILAVEVNDFFKQYSHIVDKKKLRGETVDPNEANFLNRLAVNQKNITFIDSKELATEYIKETEVQNEKTRKYLKDKNYIFLSGKVVDVDQKGDRGEYYGYTKYFLKFFVAGKSKYDLEIDGIYITCLYLYANSDEDKKRLLNMNIGSYVTIAGKVQDYGDWVGLILNNCSLK